MPVKHPFIEAENVSFTYNSNVVLDSVSFTIDKGDYVGIIGPNGGGKTTLLKILVGLLTPQSGEVRIDGIPVAEFKNKSHIGYVPQRIAQESVSFPATVYEVVESGRVGKKGLFGRLGEEDMENINQALQVAHIENLKDKLMGNLSGGQRQRVHVARALASQPEVLILDEPFVGIDITAQEDFYAFLKDLNNNRNLTIIFVSHDINVITEEVKSVLCLNRGLLCLDSPAVLHEPHIIKNLYGKRITHIHHSH